MERVKFTLCPQCTECPKIEITGKGVPIGEGADHRFGCRVPNGTNSPGLIETGQLRAAA